MKATAFMIAVLVGASGGAVSSAQSLGELAQKEKERRAALKTQSVQRTSGPVRVYGQNDVKTVMAEEAEPVEGEAAKTAAVAATTPQAPAADPQEAQRQSWRSRGDAIRADIANADKDVKAMEALGPGLTVPPDALIQARARLASAKQQLDQLEDEARRMGVPPGWVR
jgi:hypothetical protein